VVVRGAGSGGALRLTPTAASPPRPKTCRGENGTPVEAAPPGSLAGLPSGDVAAGLVGPARPAAETAFFSRHFATL